MNDCLEVCTKTDGCRLGIDTHKISILYSLDSYKKLNSHFK